MLRRGARERRVGLDRGRFPSLWTCWHHSCVMLPSPKKMLMVVALHPYATLHTLPHQSHHSNECNTQIQTKRKPNKSTSIVKKKASKEYEIKKRNKYINYTALSEWIHRIKLEVQRDACNHFRLKKKLRNQNELFGDRKADRTAEASFVS